MFLSPIQLLFRKVVLPLSVSPSLTNLHITKATNNNRKTYNDLTILQCMGFFDDVEKENVSLKITRFTNEKITKITIKMIKEILKITLRKEIKITIE